MKILRRNLQGARIVTIKRNVVRGSSSMLSGKAAGIPVTSDVRVSRLCMLQSSAGALRTGRDLLLLQASKTDQRQQDRPLKGFRSLFATANVKRD